MDNTIGIGNQDIEKIKVYLLNFYKFDMDIKKNYLLKTYLENYENELK